MRTLAAALFLCFQEHQHPSNPSPVALQPMAQQARVLTEALNYFGQPLTSAEQRRINDAIGMPDEAAAVEALERIFDSHVLSTVDINPESRVKVEQGAAKPDLAEEGARLFLVKVVNSAHVTAQLNVVSPDSGDVFLRSSGEPDPAITLTPQALKDRWADISLVRHRLCAGAFRASGSNTRSCKFTAGTRASARRRFLSTSVRDARTSDFATT
jgi:hypothetical protein